MQHLGFYLILLLFTFISTLILTKTIIPRLKKIAKQPIYESGPSWHIKKTGTPTMGGLGFIIPSIIFTMISSIWNFWNKSRSFGLSLIISAIFCLLNALVGVWDDITKIKHSNNAGLTPKQKLVLQAVIAFAFLIARNKIVGDTTVFYFGNIAIDFGWLYFPISLFFILGIINCANLTDGVDGLESSVSFAIATSTFFISMGRFNDAWSLSAIGIGATLGFLFFNIHPAKIFMGDTGSLFLGALCVCYAFSLKSLPAYLLIGGVYVIEGISVIAQVIFFKATGKRIFKMAPLHHHMEKCGFDESKICVYAILATFFLSLFASAFMGDIFQ
jgi:phospho-N-acetylmuramoyl-pentapeptide-transferase